MYFFLSIFHFLVHGVSSKVTGTFITNVTEGSCVMVTNVVRNCILDCNFYDSKSEAEYDARLFPCLRETFGREDGVWVSAVSVPKSPSCRKKRRADFRAVIHTCWIYRLSHRYDRSA
jgi:hypothetical protein